MAETDPYILNRDAAASTRLTAQHHVLTTKQGYLIHPSIVPHIESLLEPRIADIACGNGIWAIDVARRHPRARVVGMDLSTDQFPAQWSVSPQSSTSNLSFLQQDLLKPFPEQLLGTFDVVNCKHFVSTGPIIPDLTLLLRQFHALLKPGGFLQWNEPTWPTAAKVSAPTLQDLRLDLPKNSSRIATLPHANLINVTERTMKVATRMNFTRDFPAFLTSVPGLFEDASMEIPAIVPELLEIETTMWLMNWEEMLSALAKKAGVESGIYKECWASYQEDKKYVAEGGLWTYVMAVGIARRIRT